MTAPWLADTVSQSIEGELAYLRLAARLKASEPTGDEMYVEVQRICEDRSPPYLRGFMRALQKAKFQG